MNRQEMQKRIGEVCTHPVVSCYQETPIAEVLSVLEAHNFVVVIDRGDGRLVGIVSRIDVVREYLRETQWWEKPVGSVMTPRDELVWLPNHVDLSRAVELLVETGKHQLVVCGPAEGGGFPMGVITLADVIREMPREIGG